MPRDTDELIRYERLDLIEVLEELSPHEWATPSLCSAWSVQEVAAHLAYTPVQSLRTVLADMARGRFRVNEVNTANAVRWARRGTTAILEQLRMNAARNAKPSGIPGAATLADSVVHAIDIRRPLGRSRPIPHDAFAATADHAVGLRWPQSIAVGGDARRRLAGVRLVADGTEWAYGEGPEVAASAETVLLVLTGRPVGADELSGPGAATLAARLRPR